MPASNLGLFDTSPDRQQIRWALFVAGLLLSTLLLLPVQNVRTFEFPAFVPIIDAVLLVTELITAVILYAQASVFRSRGLLILASCFIISAILVGGHALTFPGAFAPDGLLGAGVNTTAWLGYLRFWAFPIAVIPYALLRSPRSATPETDGASFVAPAVLAAIAVGAALTTLATAGHDLLPPLFLDHREVVVSNLYLASAATIALTVAAITSLYLRRRSILDLWLIVALVGWLIQQVLTVTLQSRFTLGWYGTHGVMLASNLVVMLALLVESTRLYARLAQTLAAREREYEVRLTAMEAVAASVAHEVGQPLTAATLSAKAGLKWLTRAEPDRDRAISALRDTIAAGQRSLDVIRSVRATFARGQRTHSRFSLNELARETVALLERELAAEHVTLQFMLDEALPTVTANRVQLQRVLINLLTNAVEAVSATGRRARRIDIRSTRADEDSVLLEVSDSGAGIAPGEMDRIFDPFFTTKPAGTGVGLSLSRTIVEGHGGRLWASPNDDQGATFHLQIPRSPELALARG